MAIVQHGYQPCFSLQGFTEGNVIMPTFLTWLKVDVRDVALAHIRAAESSTAQVSLLCVPTKSPPPTLITPGVIAPCFLPVPFTPILSLASTRLKIFGLFVVQSVTMHMHIKLVSLARQQAVCIYLLPSEDTSCITLRIIQQGFQGQRFVINYITSRGLQLHCRGASS